MFEERRRGLELFVWKGEGSKADSVKRQKLLEMQEVFKYKNNLTESMIRQENRLPRARAVIVFLPWRYNLTGHDPEPLPSVTLI